MRRRRDVCRWTRRVSPSITRMVCSFSFCLFKRVFLKWNGHFLLVLLVQSRLILDESAIQPTRTIQGCVEAVEEEMPGAGNTAERLDSGWFVRHP